MDRIPCIWPGSRNFKSFYRWFFGRVGRVRLKEQWLDFGVHELFTESFFIVYFLTVTIFIESQEFDTVLQSSVVAFYSLELYYYYYDYYYYYYYYYYAAVLIGRSTGLACPSVPYGLLTRKLKRAEKPKLAWTFSWDRSDRCANFQFKRSQG